MKKLLVVVDMQNDFINGALGTIQAQKIVPNVVNKIINFNGDIAVTQDTHYDDYLQTHEGKNLPVMHCLSRSYGHIINLDILEALKKKENKTFFEKSTFASKELLDYINQNNYDYVELVGLCTDICVVSNAITIRSFFPEIDITVDSKCCAGTTTVNHVATIRVLKSCQINVI